MEDLIRRTMGPSIAVEVKAEPGLWTTRVDVNQLENALLNLCINARDAMRGGGALTIETTNIALDEAAAGPLDLPIGDYVCLRVSDTGTGMPPDVIRQAFDPFFTTKPIGEGTGLGLAMIHSFARQAGGQVHIASQMGRGTTVSLYLPRYIGTAVQPDDSAKPDTLGEAPRAACGETVLVVDDEVTVRELVTEVLEELGYAVITAADGPTGLELLDSGASVDLLVTDIGLPGGMDGQQLAEAARAAHPGLKVLFITGYDGGSPATPALLAHGMQVLTKPFAMRTFAAHVKGIIATA